MGFKSKIIKPIANQIAKQIDRWSADAVGAQQKVFEQLMEVRSTLEKHYKDMQDLEFTVEEGKLYMLQTRRGKRTPAATFKMAADMVKEGLISEGEAIFRITPEDIERLFSDAGAALTD